MGLEYQIWRVGGSPLNRIPKNEQEFNELMRAVDDSLMNRGVRIEDRPLLAAGEVASILRTDVPIVGVEHAVPGVYVDKSLGAHIYAWYLRRYGDRLKADFTVGQAIISIMGNPYRLVVPRIFGQVTFAIYRTLERYLELPSYDPEPGRRTRALNVLALIRGLTDAIVEELNDDVLRAILQSVTRTTTLFHRLADSSLPHHREAMADLRVAVDSILSSQPAYGLSRWSSLQFSEKLMKSLLRTVTQDVPFTHDLGRLNNLLTQHGLPTVPTTLLDMVQCTADVRYDNSLVKMEEAILAHHMSLNIAAHLINEQPPFPEQPTNNSRTGT